MRHCKIFCTCLTTLIILTAVFSLDVKLVKATLNVTETATHITIDNGYFIANVTNDAGAIRHFYIKPHTDVNIVCDRTMKALGGHEFFNAEIGYSGGDSQWATAFVGSVDIGIVYQRSDVVVVRAETVWDTTLGSELNITLISYKTFYADRPYYLSSDTRIPRKDMTQTYNSQTCFLLDVDNYWDRDADPNSWYGINGTGQVEKGFSGYTPLIDARAFDTFPWMWALNSTLNTGYGAILIDAKPYSYDTYIGGIAGGGGSEYSEFQIDYPIGYAEEESMTVTYVGVVQSSTSYSYIQQLASDLYLSNTEVVRRYTPVYSNQKHSDFFHNRLGKDIGWTWEPSPAVHGFYWRGRQGTATWCSNPTHISNDSGTFSPWKWTDVELTDYIYNDNYTMINYTLPYGALNIIYKIEVWSDSDTYTLTYLLETVDATNITDAYVSFYSGASDVDWIALDSSHCKSNATELPNVISEEGWVLKNATNIKWSSGPPTHLNAYYYWVDNDTQQEYESGQVWNITLYMQYFRRYDWQCYTDYFDVSDFKEPSEQETTLRDTLNLAFWMPCPLFNQEGNMRLYGICDNSSGFYSIVHTKYSNNKLKLVSVGEPGSTATIQIYTETKGKPKAVDGAASWTYNTTSKILTIAVTHSGENEVVVDWTPIGVGGIVVPIDKIGLLVPYIGSTLAIVIASVATAIYLKNVKRGSDKQ